jgi:hydrogenase maturation protein HypF
MALEFATGRAREPMALPPMVVRGGAGMWIVDWRPPLTPLLHERERGTAPEPPCSTTIHDEMSAALVEVARRVGRRRVVLTAGCFQNARLTERTVDRLCAAGFAPHFHRHIPPNDAGLAVGQAVFAARPLTEDPPIGKKG